MKATKITNVELDVNHFLEQKIWRNTSRKNMLNRLIFTTMYKIYAYYYKEFRETAQQLSHWSYFLIVVSYLLSYVFKSPTRLSWSGTYAERIRFTALFFRILEPYFGIFRQILTMNPPLSGFIVVEFPTQNRYPGSSSIHKFNFEMKNEVESRILMTPDFNFPFGSGGKGTNGCGKNKFSIL